METSSGGATCIIDRDGIIVWASPEFVGLFSHRAVPVGMPFNHLFSGLTDVCRHGTSLEDRDRTGRRGTSGRSAGGRATPGATG